MRKADSCSVPSSVPLKALASLTMTLHCLIKVKYPQSGKEISADSSNEWPSIQGVTDGFHLHTVPVLIGCVPSIFLSCVLLVSELCTRHGAVYCRCRSCVL